MRISALFDIGIFMKICGWILNLVIIGQKYLVLYVKTQVCFIVTAYINYLLHNSMLTVSCSKQSHIVAFVLRELLHERRRDVRLHVPCLACYFLYLNLSFLSYIILYTLFLFYVRCFLQSLSFLLLSFHLTLTLSLSFALPPYPQLFFSFLCHCFQRISFSLISRLASPSSVLLFVFCK